MKSTKRLRQLWCVALFVTGAGARRRPINDIRVVCAGPRLHWDQSGECSASLNCAGRTKMENPARPPPLHLKSNSNSAEWPPQSGRTKPELKRTRRRLNCLPLSVCSITWTQFSTSSRSLLYFFCVLCASPMLFNVLSRTQCVRRRLKTLSQH